MDGVKHLYIENFHSIKQAEIIHIPADCQWVLLFGENGSGITHLLQALHIGIAGTKNARHLMDGDWAKHLRIMTHLRVKKENLIHDLQWDPQKKEWPVIDCPRHFCSYGANRLEMRQRQYYFDNPLDSNASGLLQENEPLLNIESWMKDQALQEKTDPGARERRTNVIALFMEIMPHISEIRLEGSQLFYRELGYKCSFFELDKGHQVIIATIGDMLIRLFAAHPQENDPVNFAGIVIMDQLELHLSTTYQSKFIALLSRAFPKVQFICGTSSSIIVDSAPKNSKVFKVERDEWAGTTITDLKMESEEAVARDSSTDTDESSKKLRVVLNKDRGKSESDLNKIKLPTEFLSTKTISASDAFMNVVKQQEKEAQKIFQAMTSPLSNELESILRQQEKAMKDLQAIISPASDAFKDLQARTSPVSDAFKDLQAGTAHVSDAFKDLQARTSHISDALKGMLRQQVTEGS